MRPVLSASISVLLFVVAAGSGPAAAQTDQQINRLQEMARESRSEWQIRHADAVARAERAGIPIRQVLSDGTVIELQKFENDHPVYYITHNREAAEVSSVNTLWPQGEMGISLTGSNQIITMWEGGVPRGTHQELEGRITPMNADANTTNHATHVAGTMVATGMEYDARGMAWEAGVESYNWDDNVSELAEAASNGRMVSNNSWGQQMGWQWNRDEMRWYWYGDTGISETVDYSFGFYDSRAQAWDEIMYNAPNFLIVKSAGNDRNDDPGPQPINHMVWDKDEENWTFVSTEDNIIREPDGGDDGYRSLGRRATAKNILTVGAVESNTDMAVFSGWGPTNDGRIKPDIVAKGVSVYSANSSGDNAYGTSSGTSMSSPVVTGSAALLQQYYEQLNGTHPRASTIKSLIIHTADPLGSGAGPDYSNGWGFLNTRRAAELLRDDAETGLLSRIQKVSLPDNGSHEYQVWSNGKEPLKATIAWTDPQGTPADPAVGPTDLMLVNDLDLRITDSQGSEFQPWILNPSSPDQPATTGDNTRDNVEQVYIEAPERGFYTVHVSHKGSLQGGSQDFALVVSGDDEPPAGVLTFAGEGEEGLAWAPHNTWTNITGDYLTIEFWMNMDASSDPDAVILTKKVEGDNSYGYRIRLVGDGEERRLMFAPTSSSFRHLTTRTGIRADEWTHIAAVYNEGYIALYINGELDVEDTVGGNIRETENRLKLGTNTFENGQFYRGRLGDLRIWGTGRSMFQVRDHFTGPLSGDETGLRVYYPFHKESTGTVSDATPGGSDLTLYNIAGVVEPGVFPITPLAFGKIGDRSVELKVYERPFFEEPYAESVASEFRIYRSERGPDPESETGTQNGSRTLVTSVETGPDAVYYTDSGLANGQTYVYEVTVVDDEGYEGGFSNPLMLTPNQQIGGTSLTFGGEGYVAFPYRPGLDISGTEMTIEFWIKRDRDSSGEQVILANKTSRSDYGYGFYLEDGGEEARITFGPTSASFRHVTSNRGIRADEWTHVAGVYHEGIAQIYINGELDVENISSSASVRASDKRLTLGSNIENNARFFKGQLDELKIWNRRRSVTEIIGDFNKPLWGDEEGLAGYWRFDASSENIVYGQAMRPATAVGGGSQTQAGITHEAVGVYPVPPRIFAVPDNGEGQISLHLEQPGYAGEQVQEYRIYRSSENSDRSLLATLSGGENVYHDDVPEYGTTFFYDATIVDGDGGESDRAYPVTSARYEDRPAGHAMRFATNQRAFIEFEYNPALDITGDSITVEAWVRKDEVGQQGAVILGNNRYRFSFVDDGPASRILFEPMSPNFRQITSQTWLQPGKWYHIAGVYREGDIWLYINGAQDNFGSHSAGTIGSSAAGLVMGANHIGSDNYFIGELDEVRVWKRALEGAEVTAYYNRTRTGNEHGLIGYWRFDEPDGDILRSSAHRPLHGTLVNGPVFVPSAAMEGDPFAPVLATPENGAEDLDIPLTFTWHPVDNAPKYELEISPNTDFKSVIFEKEIDDTTHAVARGLDYDSTYHWRVRAVTNQFPSNWSASRQLHIKLPVPAAPTWEPDQEAEDVELPVAFSWGESEFAETYRIQIGTDSDFITMVLDTAGIAQTVLIADNLVAGNTYYWRVSASNKSGESEWSAVREFTTVITSADNQYGAVPDEFALRQNYPNPFNPTTQIRYSVAEHMHVRLEVYNTLGQRVATLVDEEKSPGSYAVPFDASGLSSGVYIYRLQTDVYVKSRQMVLVR